MSSHPLKKNNNLFKDKEGVLILNLSSKLNKLSIKQFAWLQGWTLTLLILNLSSKLNKLSIKQFKCLAARLDTHTPYTKCEQQIKQNKY